MSNPPLTLRQFYASNPQFSYMGEILEYDDPPTLVQFDDQNKPRFIEDHATVMLHEDLNMLDLNQLNRRWHARFSGLNSSGDCHYKNDPRYRILMQRIGYSVFGYWELTRWEVNNPFYEQFKGYS